MQRTKSTKFEKQDLPKVEIFDLDHDEKNQSSSYRQVKTLKNNIL